MEYVYAALLLHKAGKEINEENIKKVMEAAGVSVEDAKVKALVAALENVDIEDAMNKGISMPVGSVAPQQEPSQAGSAEESKKEEKKEEDKGKSEEEAAAGLGALFG